MKKFEIEVVRSFTTIIEIEVEDGTTEAGIIDAIHYGSADDALSDDIWDLLSEQELEQMNTDMMDYKVKEL